MERTPPPNLSVSTPRSVRSTGSGSVATPTFFDDAATVSVEELAIGNPVWVRRKGQPLMEGEVAYLGDVEFAEQSDERPWVGVRLTGTSADLGKHNGTVEGVSYFETDKPHAGIFVRIAALSKRTVHSSNPSTPTTTATTAAPTAVNMFRSPVFQQQRSPGVNGDNDANAQQVPKANPPKATKMMREEEGEEIDWDEQERRLVALEEWKLRKSPTKIPKSNAVTPSSSAKKKAPQSSNNVTPTSSSSPAAAATSYSPSGKISAATKASKTSLSTNNSTPSKETASPKDPPMVNVDRSPAKSAATTSSSAAQQQQQQSTSNVKNTAPSTTTVDTASKGEDSKPAARPRRKVPPAPVSADVLAHPPSPEESEPLVLNQGKEKNRNASEGNASSKDRSIPTGENDVRVAEASNNTTSRAASQESARSSPRYAHNKNPPTYGFFQSFFVCLSTMVGWITPGLLGATLVLKEQGTQNRFETELAAGLVLGQLVTSVILATPLFMMTLLGCVCCCSPTTSSVFVWNMARVSNALTFWMGLILLVTILTSSMRQEHGDTVGLEIMGSAAGTMIVSAVAVMVSFWPATTKQNSGPRLFRRHTYALLQTVGGTNNDDEIQNDSLTEPLLAESETDVEAPDVGEDEVPTEGERDSHDQDGQGEEESTSRLRGTRRLLQMASSQVLYLYLGCAALLIRLPFSLAIPHFVSTTLAALGHGDFHTARQEVLYLFVLGSIDAVLDFWCIFLFGYANERIIRGVRTDLFSKLLRMEISFFDSNHSGTLSSRLNSDCSEMAGDLTWFFRFSIESVVRIVGITTYMMIRSPHLGACALSIIPVIGIINKLYGDWLRENAIAVQDSLAEANKVAQETLSNARTVIAFAAEGLEESNYNEKIQSYYKLRVKQIFMTGVYYMTVSTFLINTVIQASLLYYGAYLIQQGHLTPEVLLAFMLYQGQLQQETQNLFNSFSSLIKSSGAGDKVFALLDRQPPPPATGSTEVQETAATLASEPEPLSYELSLQNVSFAYPTRPAQPVLKGMTLDFPKGSTVALVGKR